MKMSILSLSQGVCHVKNDTFICDSENSDFVFKIVSRQNNCPEGLLSNGHECIPCPDKNMIVQDGECTECGDKMIRDEFGIRCISS